MGVASTGAVALMLASLVSSCTGSGSSASGCVPPPESCDLSAPRMTPVEANGCLGAPTVLRQVCVTSVNRCSASAGLGVVCAFAPDGTVYVMVGSDNDVLTAPGWHFAQYVEPAMVPSDQVATADEAATCQQLSCASPCPGVSAPNFDFPFLPSSICSVDSGGTDGSDAGD